MKMNILIILIILGCIVFACQTDQPEETHKVQLISYNLITRNASVYDLTDGNMRLVRYSRTLFQMTEEQLYSSQFDHPIFLFNYQNNHYYSIL